MAGTPFLEGLTYSTAVGISKLQASSKSEQIGTSVISIPSASEMSLECVQIKFISVEIVTNSPQRAVRFFQNQVGIAISVDITGNDGHGARKNLPVSMPNECFR